MYNTTLWCVCVTTVTAEKQPASRVLFGCMSLSTDVTAQQCIVCNAQLSLNNVKLLCVTMETQQWVPFTLFKSYRIFHISANNVLRS